MKSNSIRLTPFRRRVLDLFQQKSTAQSLKDIEHTLVSFDRITLYRTLKLFVEKGILHEIVLPHDKKYALCKDSCGESGHKHEHLHFHCSKCEDTLCLESDLTPIKLKGFKVESTELNVFGVCHNCQ